MSDMDGFDLWYFLGFFFFMAENKKKENLIYKKLQVINLEWNSRLPIVCACFLFLRRHIWDAHQVLFEKNKRDTISNQNNEPNRHCIQLPIGWKHAFLVCKSNCAPMKLLQCICNFLERLHAHAHTHTFTHTAQSFIEISSWAYQWAAQAKTQRPANLPAPREETGNDIRRAHVDVQMCMSFSVNTIEWMQSNHVRWIWIMTPLNAAARDTSPFQIHIPVKDLSKLGEQMFQSASPLALASPLLQNRPRQYWRSPTGQLYHRLYSLLRRFEPLALLQVALAVVPKHHNEDML